MVAMLGWIMPEPLAMPVTVTVLPPTCAGRLAPLATMSVVMMACAASDQWQRRQTCQWQSYQKTARGCLEFGNHGQGEHHMEQRAKPGPQSACHSGDH